MKLVTSPPNPNMHGANDVVHLSSFQVASYEGAMQLRNQRNDIEALELVS